MLTRDPEFTSPFHAGEQEVQRRNGKRDTVESVGNRVIRPFMLEQHRAFFEQLPFVVVGAVDREGWPWASLLTGEPGFVRSPDPGRLRIGRLPIADDPIGGAIRDGDPLGVLGIQLETRRRNRVNGRVSALSEVGFTLEVDQSFGNCPKYIQARDLIYPEIEPKAPRVQALGSLRELDGKPAALIAEADTFFVSSYMPAGQNPAKEGVDVSHRGGRPGFVRLRGETLTIPDFRGNNYFNTLGNFLLNPLAGLVFPDFMSGNLLFVTGTVELLEGAHPEIASFQGAERGWRFNFQKGVWLEGVLPLRAGPADHSPNTLLTGTW